MKQVYARWEIELFDASNIPTQGYVFFAQGRSYVCYPSEPTLMMRVCLAWTARALRQYVEREPPAVLYVPQLQGDAVTADFREMNRIARHIDPASVILAD